MENELSVGWLIFYSVVGLVLFFLVKHFYKHIQMIKKLQHIPGRVYPFYFWYSLFTKDDWAFYPEQHIQRNLQFASLNSVEGDSSRKGFWKVIAGTEAYLHTWFVKI